MRYWEVVSHIYESWNVDFFISTWDTNDRQDNYPYKFHGNKNINDEIVDGLDNLAEVEFLPKEIENKFTFNIPKYWYLIHRCNILKTKREVKENFKYDCVIVTRPDSILKKNMIRRIPKKLDELYVYSSKISPSDETFGFQTMDSLSYGTSSTMDIYSSLYKHIYMSEDYNVIPMGHSLIPFYMKYIGLNMSNKEITHDMINKIRKPKQYEKLKGEYNV